MNRAPVDSRFGKLPASDAELNGDYLQALVRLATMTGDRRFLEWARRIADAYIEEVLPGTYGVPGRSWDFQNTPGDTQLRLRDHGNEMVVGLSLQYALETYFGTPRAEKYRPVIQAMLDRILRSANPDGLLYNEVDAATLEADRTEGFPTTGATSTAPSTRSTRCTGEAKYRDAVRRVLAQPAEVPQVVLGAVPAAAGSATRLVRRLRRLDRKRDLSRAIANPCRRRSTGSTPRRR